MDVYEIMQLSQQRPKERVCPIGKRAELSMIKVDLPYLFLKARQGCGFLRTQLSKAGNKSNQADNTQDLSNQTPKTQDLANFNLNLI